MRDRGRRSIAALIIVLAVVDVAAWAYLFKRQPAKSSYVSRVTSTGLPPLVATPTPTPSPSATPSAAASLAELPPLTLDKPAGQSLNLALVGDSLQTGDYASSAGNSYRSLVLASLKQRGPVNDAPVIPFGTSDLSTAQAVPGGMDVVVVEIGTDDMTKTDVAGFTRGYDALLTSIRAGSPDAAVVCAGTWSSNGQAYDAIIKRDCLFVGGRYVQLESRYNVAANRGPAGVTGPYGTSDDSAPNDAGHRAIAAALLAPIGLTLS